MPNKPIYVTMPSLPPIEEYFELLRGVWERGILTHNGPMVQKFESDLSSKLNLPGFVAVANGTIAIQMAIKALQLRGEIITTSFTWVATVSAIQAEGCTPIFVDIDPETLNMDPLKIEQYITPRTVAIMPVHVFGNPCDVDAIKKVAEKYNLKVIYDAAHAIGSTYNNQSLLAFGDISATSLHATKLLNTGEGGGCVSTDQRLLEKLKHIRFFGHDENKQIVEEGMNGKMTEIHAALGLANLKYYDHVLSDRKYKYLRYMNGLGSCNDLRFQKLVHGEPNYSYFPIIFESEKLLEVVIKKLEAENIYARRYFYPTVNTFDSLYPYSATPIAEDISRRILCLPLYFDLEIRDVDRIIKIISNG